MMKRSNTDTGSLMEGMQRKEGGEKGGGKARRSRNVGVTWDMGKQKWRAEIMVAGVNQHLGFFDCEADGARFARRVGKQNLLNLWNFPDDSGAKQGSKRRRRNNISTIPDRGKSRYFGVSWCKKAKKWTVQTTIDRKGKFIGLYADETAAARAFDAFVIPNNIDKNLNFPDAPGAAGHRPTKHGGSSDHRGVSWNKKAKKWKSRIYVNSKQKFLGSFADEDAAGRAYDAAIRKYFPGERPHMWKGFNFPDEDGGEEGSDDGDDVESARGASSRGAAADASDVDEEDASSAKEEDERPRRRRRRRR